RHHADAARELDAGGQDEAPPHEEREAGGDAHRRTPFPGSARVVVTSPRPSNTPLMRARSAGTTETLLASSTRPYSSMNCSRSCARTAASPPGFWMAEAISRSPSADASARM